MMYNTHDDFDEDCLEKLYVSKIEEKDNCFELTFDLKEGYTIDLSNNVGLIYLILALMKLSCLSTCTDCIESRRQNRWKSFCNFTRFLVNHK